MSYFSNKTEEVGVKRFIFCVSLSQLVIPSVILFFKFFVRYFGSVNWSCKTFYHLWTTACLVSLSSTSGTSRLLIV